MTLKAKPSDIFNLTPLKMTARLEEFREEDALYKQTIPMHNNNYIFGIEVEVEGIHKINTPTYKSYWKTTADNSLRNNGIEFVSLPIKANQIEGALIQLHNKVKHERNVPDFSERTSTHVHMNVRDLTIEQIYNLVLIYTSVENILFNWVGHNRDKNIFCIKLSDTNYFDNVSNLLYYTKEIIRNWNKYTALNLQPISSKGTVEFRHLFGTWDKEIILLWINFLSCIKTYAKKTSRKDLEEEIKALNTNSLYEEYLYSIFGSYTKYLNISYSPKQTLASILEDSITFIKLCIIKSNKKSRIDWDNFALTPLTPQVENRPLRTIAERWADMQNHRIQPTEQREVNTWEEPIQEVIPPEEPLNLDALHQANLQLTRNLVAIPDPIHRARTQPRFNTTTGHIDLINLFNTPTTTN